jgi:hypothetical protein
MNFNYEESMNVGVTEETPFLNERATFLGFNET